MAILSGTSYRYIYGTTGRDRLDAAFDQGRDIIYGGAGNDYLSGLGGDDQLWGGTGNDRLYGGSGDDILEGGNGADDLYGGSGNDTASYAYARSAVTVSLDTGTGSRGAALGDTLHYIENVTGSGYNDYIYGSYQANTLSGLAGNDDIYGYGGADELFGGRGQDDLFGGSGNDELFGGDDVDTLRGGGDHDILDGGAGDDWLHGDAGNDRFIGSYGDADRIYGGSGTDTIDYREVAVSSTTETGLINLAPDVGGSGLGGDVLYSIENVYGTVGRDWIQGNSSFNKLYGWDGDDLLLGSNGSDELYGGNGNDTFHLNLQDDYVLDIADGTLDIQDAYDLAYEFHGGEGIDTIDFSNLDGLVEASREAGNFWGGGNVINLANGGNIGAIANVSSIENYIGSLDSESIHGNGSDNEINGRGGADVIDGGRGSDLLTGGDGVDTFVFAHDGWGEDDVVTDFTAGVDRVNLSQTAGVTSYADLLDGSDGDFIFEIRAGVVIHTSAEDTVTLLGVRLSDLDAGDFWF